MDGTNLPGKLHGQFLDIFERNALPKKGALKVLGKPVDLSKIKVQTLVTGGTTDHLTPWKGCYRTTQLLGGPMTFVLSNAGHVASLVNPPGNPKATYWLGPTPGPDPEQWLAASDEAHGHMVGSVGRLGGQAQRPREASAQDARQPQVQGARQGAGHLRSGAGVAMADASSLGNRVPQYLKRLGGTPATTSGRSPPPTKIGKSTTVASGSIQTSQLTVRGRN